jgi:hypothetical protein
MSDSDRRRFLGGLGAVAGAGAATLSLPESALAQSADGPRVSNAIRTASELGIRYPTTPFEFQNEAIQKALDQYGMLELVPANANNASNEAAVPGYNLSRRLEIWARNGALFSQVRVGLTYQGQPKETQDAQGNDVEYPIVSFKMPPTMQGGFVGYGAAFESFVSGLVVTAPPYQGRSRLVGIRYSIRDTSARGGAGGWGGTHAKMRAYNNFAAGMFIGHDIINNNYGVYKRLHAGVCEIGYRFINSDAPTGGGGGNVDAFVCEDFMCVSCKVGFLSIATAESIAQGDNKVNWLLAKEVRAGGTGFAMCNESTLAKGRRNNWIVHGMQGEYSNSCDGSQWSYEFDYQTKPGKMTVRGRSAEIYIAAGNTLVLADSGTATDGSRIWAYLDGDEARLVMNNSGTPHQTLFTVYASHANAGFTPGDYIPGGGINMNCIGWPARGAQHDPFVDVPDYYSCHISGFTRMHYDAQAPSTLSGLFTPLRPQFTNSQGGVVAQVAPDPETGALCTRLTFPSPTQGAKTDPARIVNNRPPGLSFPGPGLRKPGPGQTMAISAWLRGFKAPAPNLGKRQLHAVLLEVYNDETFDVDMQVFATDDKGNRRQGMYWNDRIDEYSSSFNSNANRPENGPPWNRWSYGLRTYQHIKFWSKRRMVYAMFVPTLDADFCLAFMPYRPLDTRMSLHVTKLAYVTSSDLNEVNEVFRNRAWRVPA